MSTFLITYLLCYGGLNAYGLLHVGQAWSFRWSYWLATGGMVAFLVALPILMHVFSDLLGERGSTVVAWIAWIWLAWSFWFASSLLVLDTWNIAARTCLHLRMTISAVPAVRTYTISPQIQCIIGGMFVVMASLWGWVEAGRIRVREIEIAVPCMPEGTKPLRILQLSDLHIGRTMRPRVIRRIARLAAEQNPDLLVTTGDMIDAHGPRVEAALGEFSMISAPLGRYSVVGNHEFYPGIQESLRLHENAGFTVLRGDSAHPLPWLWIVGIDFPGNSAKDRHRIDEDEQSILAKIPEDGFVLLLKHYPVMTTALGNRAGLQLSGHVHGGQIFPFGIITHLVYGLPTGRLCDRPGSGRIYVTRGAGTWGPPFRLFAPPEIPVFVLRGA